MRNEYNLISPQCVPRIINNRDFTARHAFETSCRLKIRDTITAVQIFECQHRLSPHVSQLQKASQRLPFLLSFMLLCARFTAHGGGQFKSCRHGTAPDFSQHHCTFCLACCNFCVGCLHAVLPHFPAHGWVVLCSTRLCLACPNVPQAKGNKSLPFAGKTRPFAHHVVAKTQKKGLAVWQSIFL